MHGESSQLRLIIATEEDDGQRIDMTLSNHLDISRSQAQKLIKSDKVLLLGKVPKAKDIVALGDEISVEYILQDERKFTPKELPLDIIYEDEHLMVVNKAAGVVVHPGAGTAEQTTLIEGVAYYLESQGKPALEGEEMRPGVVHRLDKDTSGAIVIAKTLKAMEHLSKQFRDKTNLREYLTLVDGVMEQETVDHENYLFRDPRHRTRYTSCTLEEYAALEEDKKSSYRYAKSHFYRHKVYGQRVSLLRVRLDTGRTHQIRVHCRDLKMPIIGDDTYGKRIRLDESFPQPARDFLLGAKRQLLHAKLLGFTHPISERKLGFEVPLPEDFKELLQSLESVAR